MKLTLDSLNLDGIDPDELWDFWKGIHFHPVSEARKLFPTRPKGYVRWTKDLAAYACNKATAMRQRSIGNIQVASTYEAICERIYQSLPKALRW